MNSLTKAMLETKASIQKARFGSWEVFSRSIVWFKLRKKMNYIERDIFIEAWSRV